MHKLLPKIIYEDKEILVIDKPSGMVVNKGETTKKEFTVQDWVSSYCHSESGKAGRGIFSTASFVQDPSTLPTESGSVGMTEKIVGDFYKRSGIVHRLDKDTSGILLIAKTLQAFLDLQSQFKERKVIKQYLALVHGIVEPKNGEIKVPIERNPFNRKKFGVFLGGKEAVTKYKTIQYYCHSEPRTVWCGARNLTQNKAVEKDPSPDSVGVGMTSKRGAFSLLELSPKTGRTHQIRVHLKYLGHPIVSDILYAGRKMGREDLKFCPRMFLHASFIKFKHPVLSKEIEFRSELPEELKIVLTKMRKYV